MPKILPFTLEQIKGIVSHYPTPFHIYDEAAIRANAKCFLKSFSWVKGRDESRFLNYFAVKALPNPTIMKILSQEGMGFDCSSQAELMLCERIGVSGEQIMFTSNDTKLEEFAYAKKLGAIINLDDITHIEYLHKGLGLPELVSFRYNPGKAREGNAIIGKPEDAKYGLTREQLFEAYDKIRALGVKRFGLHTMVASNELNADYFVETARMLFELVVDLKKQLNINIEFINLGGGIGIPYKPDQQKVDIAYISENIRRLYQEMILAAGLDPLRIVTENGRVITGPYGYLVSTAIHEKHIYKDYIGLDSCMANLMRPGIYGAYHHITVLGKENEKNTHTYDVCGSLCENNDKFAVDRELPKISIGDLVVIHDTGAHGHSMGFNYNGKLRSAELLLKPDGSVEQIRRAETYEDYFATLNLGSL